MNENKFIFYLMSVINFSIGVLSLFLLQNNVLLFISISGIFILALNLYYNKYISSNINDNTLKLFSILSISINFSIVPSLLFTTQFDFVSFKILNYFLLLLYPICSSFALVNDFIKNKNASFNYLLVILLYLFALITSGKNISNILPAILIILVSMLMFFDNFIKKIN